MKKCSECIEGIQHPKLRLVRGCPICLDDIPVCVECFLKRPYYWSMCSGCRAELEAMKETRREVEHVLQT